jgi:hypothetical protein
MLRTLFALSLGFFLGPALAQSAITCKTSWSCATTCTINWICTEANGQVFFQGQTSGGRRYADGELHRPGLWCAA